MAAKEGFEPPTSGLSLRAAAVILVILLAAYQHVKSNDIGRSD